MPHLSGLKAEKGGGRLFLLPSYLGNRDPSVGGGGTVRDSRGWREETWRCARRDGRLSRERILVAGAGKPRVRPDPRVHRAAPPPLPPVPSPGPASPRPGPLPAGSGRRGRGGGGGGLSSRLFLAHWGVLRWRHLRRQRSTAASPPASQWEVGSTDGRADGRTAGQLDGLSRFEFRHELGHGAVGESGRGAPRADPGP